MNIRGNQILEKSDASVSFFSWGTYYQKQGDIMKSKGRIKLKRDQVHKGSFWGLGLKIDSHLCSGFYLAELKHLNLDENSQCVLLKVSLKKKTHFKQSVGKKAHLRSTSVFGMEERFPVEESDEARLFS